jgi:hypothetical protein
MVESDYRRFVYNSTEGAMAPLNQAIKQAIGVARDSWDCQAMARGLVNWPKRYRWQRKHMRQPILTEANNLRIGLGLSVEQRQRSDHPWTIDHYRPFRAMSFE